MSEITTPLELLIDRRDNGIVPDKDNKDSGTKIAIAFDGGGMSSIVVAGAAHVLKEEGLADVSDMIVGVSGGSLVAATTITDQLDCTHETFTKTLPEQGFLNYWRALKRRPILDLGLLNDIIENRLDTEALHTSPIEFVFGVTNLSKFESVAISSRNISEEDIPKWLKRGIWMPRAAGPPEADENGTVWIDGGSLLETTPLLAGDASHVLNLSNSHQKLWHYDGVTTDFVGRWLKRYGGPKAADDYRDFADRQIKNINQGAPASVQIIYPSQAAELPGTFEMNPEKLEKGYVAGQNACWQAIQAAQGHEVEAEAPAVKVAKNPLESLRDSTLSFVGRRAMRAFLAIAP